LSGKNQTHARRGSILAGYFKLLPVFIFLVPGMIAFALSQKGLLDMPIKNGQPDADKAFSTLVAQLLPIGFKGIVVCGLLAALMSSLASLFNSSAALFVGDFYKKLRPASTEKHLVVVGRIATAAVVVLGILWIPVMKRMGDVLYQYLQGVQSLLAPAIAAAFAVGVFWKGATAAGGLWGLIVGFVVGMFRLVLDVVIGGKITKADALPEIEKLARIAEIKQQYGLLYSIETINWLHFCEFLFVLCVAVMILVSLPDKGTFGRTVAIYVLQLYSAGKSRNPRQLEWLGYRAYRDYSRDYHRVLCLLLESRCSVTNDKKAGRSARLFFFILRTKNYEL
jgi:SSS family solute:Na+ symporter